VTYSIVARDPETGDLGVAVQSKFLAVGAVVPWVRAGLGAIATQSYANVTYGPDGLAALAQGATAQQALDRLLAADPLARERQAGVVDAHGGSATHTGRSCFAWAGGHTGPNFAAQGNILTGPGVVDGLVETFVAGGRPFPELLVACLAAADAAGGDRRGRQSAALYVARDGAGYGGGNDRWIDLRVDDHVDPIGELARVLDLQRLYFDRPAPADLLPIDQARAVELRARLGALGWSPSRAAGAVYAPMFPADDAVDADRPVIGDPRDLPVGWDAAWHRILGDWMAVENLEERTAASGWIDPRVLEYLRRATATAHAEPPAAATR
jgi:uncharacterized Ntn-hydrolase superfamily protein